MNRRVLSFIALAISILFGVTVAVLEDHRGVVAPIGGAVVAIAWIAVGVFGRDDSPRDRDT